MILLVALSAQFFCQILKCLVYSLRNRKFVLSYLFMSGGFISSHSAFVSTLVMYVALSEGLTTPWLSISAVFAIIVIHDAFRLRGEVQKHAKILNTLLSELPTDRRRNYPQLSEQIGHSGGEVLAGILFGAGYASLFWFAIVPML